MLKYLTMFMMFLFSVQLMAANDASASATLYYSPSCGHCQKVMSYLSKEHKTVNMKNVTDASVYSEYKALGTSGVPVLVVNGQVIKGADSIIGYFRQHPEVLR